MKAKRCRHPASARMVVDEHIDWCNICGSMREYFLGRWWPWNVPEWSKMKRAK
jgi:hypothetical protein